jgi:hypothetical protein
MFIFIRLLLAHLIGDYPLQFNLIYRFKNKGLKGIIPHALLIIASLILLSWPYLNLPWLWFFILFVGITHLIQDSIKLDYGKIKYSFWIYLLDQLLHILTIAIVFLTNLKDIQPLKEPSGLIALWYNNDALIIYLIAVIAATYNGFYLIRSFKSTFFSNAGRHCEFEKWYGIIERMAIVSVFLAGGYYFLLLILPLAARPVVFRLVKDRLCIEEKFVSFSEASLSCLIALSTGIILYLTIPR